MQWSDFRIETSKWVTLFGCITVPNGLWYEQVGTTVSAKVKFESWSGLELPGSIVLLTFGGKWHSWQKQKESFRLHKKEYFVSDHEYLCRLSGLTPGQNDDELVDSVLAGDTNAMRELEDESGLARGRLVHHVVLTSETPARVVRVELNKKLTEFLSFNNFNELSYDTPSDPGSWFVERQFTVRSKKIGGYWHQYAFKNVGAGNLVRSEIISYLKDVTTLEFDESHVDSSMPTNIG